MKKFFFTIILFVYELSLTGQVTEYINLLKQYSTYSTTGYTIPAFTYQSHKTDELERFRHKYKIDSIAGQGDDFEKQVRLLKWVNNTFKHSGNTPLPEKLNADILIMIGQKTGVHCGGLAMILNAAYLSLGYKSRFITCLNNDTTFNDAHTLTIVYSDKYTKWIMLDPTYCAYFKGDDGIPLSLEEIRMKISNNQNVILNEEFHLNSISTNAGKRDDYLEYIARNMFRFISPINNNFSWNMACLDYINLIPKGYKLSSFPLGKASDEGCFKVYCIDNQKQFWK